METNGTAKTIFSVFILSFYCPIASDKRAIQINIFSYFSMNTNVVSTH